VHQGSHTTAGSVDEFANLKKTIAGADVFPGITLFAMVDQTTACLA